jgi:hypothetical protein
LHLEDVTLVGNDGTTKSLTPKPDKELRSIRHQSSSPRRRGSDSRSPSRKSYSLTRSKNYLSIGKEPLLNPLIKMDIETSVLTFSSNTEQPKRLSRRLLPTKQRFHSLMPNMLTRKVDTANKMESSILQITNERSPKAEQKRSSSQTK